MQQLLRTRFSALLFALLATGLGLHAQVGIGTTTPNAQSILHLNATDKAFLLPIATVNPPVLAPANTPTVGMMMYSTVLGQVLIYDGGWSALATGAAGGAADRTLSNLQPGVAINRSLLPGAANLDIGSTGASRWRDLYLVGEARLIETAGGNNFTGFVAPTVLTADLIYTMPTAYPASNGQVLSSTTAGVLSWASASGVTYGTATAQNTLAAGQYLFNVQYVPAAAAPLLGARIAANTTTGNANTLTLDATGPATNTALNVSASGGTANYAALFSNGNVGIGTLTPGSGLTIASSLGLGVTNNGATTLTLDASQLQVVNTNAAATTNTLPATSVPLIGRTYYIWSTGAAGVTIGVNAPGTESLNGTLGGTFTVATGQCAVVTCVAANNWRAIIQAPTAGGVGGGWSQAGGFVNLATQTDNVGIGVAASTTNKVSVENATVAMGAGNLYAGLRTRMITSSATVAADTLAGHRNIVRTGAGVGITAGQYNSLTHAGTGGFLVGSFYDMYALGGAGVTGTAYNIEANGAGSSRGIEITINRAGAGNVAGLETSIVKTGAGNATGLQASIINSSSGNVTLLDAQINGSGTAGAQYTGLQITVAGEADATTNYAGLFTINTTNPSGTNVGLNVNASGGGTNYAALLNGGNVGIGTSTPGALLHVEGGDIVQRENGFDNNFLTYGAAGTMMIGAANGSFGAPAALGAGSNIGSYRFRVFDGGGYTGGAEMRANYVGGAPAAAANAPTSLTFATTANGSGTLTDRMTIASDGQVGIGTAPNANILAIGGSMSVVGNNRTIDFDAGSTGSTVQVGTTGSGNAGPLTLRSGTTASAGNGGTIFLLSGGGAGAGNTGGSVSIIAGDNGTGIGGTISLSPGSGASAASAGVLQANIHNRGAQGGAATPTIASGTYNGAAAASQTGVVSVAGTAITESQWLRVGNVVTWSGRVTVNTSGPGAGSFTIPLPIASNLISLTGDASGTFDDATGSNNRGIVAPTGALNRVSFICATLPAGSNDFFFTITYVVK